MSEAVDKSNLEGTLARSLEALAFILAQPCAAHAGAPADAVVARVPLGTCGRRYLELAAGRGLGTLVETNLLSPGPGEPRESRAHDAWSDALKELANITAGPLLKGAECQGRTAPKLGIPQVREMNEPNEWRDFANSRGACVLDAEGHTVAMRLSVETGEACA